MPTDRSVPPEPDEPPEVTGRAPARPDDSVAGRRREARRVVIDPAGPVLVEGPVEVQLPDGSTAVSDRFLVAICACRRSRTYPWCDTSHRRRGRPSNAAESPGGGQGEGSGGGAGSDERDA